MGAGVMAGTPVLGRSANRPAALEESITTVNFLVRARVAAAPLVVVAFTDLPTRRVIGTRRIFLPRFGSRLDTGRGTGRRGRRRRRLALALALLELT